MTNSRRRRFSAHGRREAFAFPSPAGETGDAEQRVGVISRLDEKVELGLATEELNVRQPAQGRVFSPQGSSRHGQWPDCRNRRVINLNPVHAERKLGRRVPPGIGGQAAGR